MKQETRYRLQKRIKELEADRQRLIDERYEFRGACSEIYEGALQVLNKNHTSISISWILGRLRRVWK